MSVKYITAKKVLVLIIILLLQVSCKGENQKSTLVNDPKPDTHEYLTITPAGTLSTQYLPPTSFLKLESAKVTATLLSSTKISPTTPPAPLVTALPITGPFPDLLIQTSQEIDLIEFIDEGTSQIWTSQYPYQEFLLLLSDPVLNYFTPTWSPNGNSIAYIQSQNGYYDLYTNEPISRGADSIWMMRSDGTERKKISPSYDNFNIVLPDGVKMRGSYLLNELFWSPDGKYLAYWYLSSQLGYEWDIDIYVINIETGEHQLVARTNSVAAIAWSPNSRDLVFNEGKDIIVVHIFDDGRLSKQKIDGPPVEGLINKVEWPFDEPFPYVTIEESEGDGRWSIWGVDFQSGAWEMKIDLDQLGVPGSKGTNTYMGLDSVLSFGFDKRDNNYLLNTNTWKLRATIPTGLNADDFGPPVRWISDYHGDEIVTFVAGHGAGQIWAVKPGEGELQPELIVNLDAYFSGVQLNDYHWRPANSGK